MIIDQFSEEQNQIVSDLVVQLNAIDGVVAIVLGGSFASGKATLTSDIDLGLYYHDDAPFSIDGIREIAELVNDTPKPTIAHFGDWGKWVNGGAWLTIEGQRVDLLYRSLDTLQHWIEQSKNGIIELDYYQQPVTGFYSYMYLAELAICVPLMDDSGHIASLKEKILDYPPKLKAKIIKEFSWMADFTLYHARVAAERSDMYSLVGCLHRIIACIVQILYAKNERYFLSDKGAIADCAAMPMTVDDFDVRIAGILSQPDFASVDRLKAILKTVILK